MISSTAFLVIKEDIHFSFSPVENLIGSRFISNSKLNDSCMADEYGWAQTSLQPKVHPEFCLVHGSQFCSKGSECYMYPELRSAVSPLLGVGSYTKRQGIC